MAKTAPQDRGVMLRERFSDIYQVPKFQRSRSNAELPGNNDRAEERLEEVQPGPAGA
jgi:hypothetical protein